MFTAEEPQSPLLIHFIIFFVSFDSITKTRTEVIFQGTRNHTVIPNGIWHEYEFKCKPGDIKRRPCLISPYHYRLDWLMWFAAFQVSENEALLTLLLLTSSRLINLVLVIVFLFPLKLGLIILQLKNKILPRSFLCIDRD